MGAVRNRVFIYRGGVCDPFGMCMPVANEVKSLLKHVLDFTSFTFSVRYVGCPRTFVLWAGAGCDFHIDLESC